MQQHKQKGTSGRLFSRLTRAGRHEDVAVLAAYIAARDGAAANDNGIGEDTLGTDSIMVMRPTPEELIASSRTAEDGTVGVVFDDSGKLVAWRPVDADGNISLTTEGDELWLKPVERYMQPKGSRRKTGADLSANSGEHAEFMVSLRGSGRMPHQWVPDTRYPSVGVVYERIKAAYDKIIRIGIQSAARQFLDFHMVDGGRTLEQAVAGNPQARVARGKTVVAYGAEFISGRTESNDGAGQGSFVGAPDAAEMAMIAAMDAKTLAIGEELEMALSGMTLREIAKTKGHNDNKGGEEWAARAVDRQIAELKNLHLDAA